VVPPPPPKPAAKPAAPPAGARPASARPKSLPHGDAIALVISLLVPVAITVLGWSYYSIPTAARLRHPLNSLLRPSGMLGLAMGVLGFSLFLFMWLYPFRKKVKWLAWTGPLGAWMRVHAVVGLALPLIVAVHAGWHFNGMIGMGYLCMIVVSLSGIVGRYLYVHIPHSRNGLEMTMEEVSGERRALITEIAAACGLVPAEVERWLAVDTRPYDGLDPARTLWRMFQDDISRARLLRALEHELARPHSGRPPLDREHLRVTMKLARRELALTQQVRMLDATRRIFAFWHVAHRPFAITALIALLVHVCVAVFVGGIGWPLGH
jgi:hypothetical protein